MTRKLCIFAALLASAPLVFGATYYVDDGVTNGNVYTTAPGNDANPGTSPATPMRTLTNLLHNVGLLPGDVVYIDTGVYPSYTVTVTNSGSMGSPIVFQGSTNRSAGGTIFERNSPSQDGFVLTLRQYLEFRDLRIRKARNGIAAALAQNIVLDRVEISETTTALARGQWTIRRSLFLNNSRLRDPAGGATFDFDHCVFWNNENDESGITELPITLHNSVYVGGDLRAELQGDYNVFWNVRLLNQNRAYLSEYNMPNSMFADPMFANPAATNFYPKSVTGRYNPATGGVVTDAVHSILIDFGDPASAAWTNEPAPNGGRVNAGAYGQTELASRSRTNAWLQAVTFSDGGAATGAIQTLVWNYGGFTNGATVSVQFRPCICTVWSNIATGVAVTNRSVAWNLGSVAPAALLWRVVADDNTNLWSRNNQPFSVGGARVQFYLDDASTNGNVYTTAPGSDLNDGLSPQAPMRTLTNLVATYRLGKHDQVLIDAGVYSNYTTEVSGYGLDGQPIIFEGAPKVGATVFRRNFSASIFVFRAEHYLLRNLTLEGSAGNGAINGGRVILEDSVVRNNTIGLRDVTLTARNSVLASNTTLISASTGQFDFDRCVFWNNGQLQISSRPWSISNSVIVGGTANGLGLLSGADYNVLWNVTLDGYPNLSELQRLSSFWTHSTVLDPLFANAATGDFRPRSLTGRYDPVLDTFVTDAVHSPLIDFGDPGVAAWTNEPDPNGGRINAGAFGGVATASKSRTNAWLQVLSLNDGGQINVPGESVRWFAGNLPSGATVRIEFSFNSGFSWVPLASNLAASSEAYTIATTNYPSSRFARWRVVLESNPSVLSATTNDALFKSGPFTYYVNDSSLSGDVYTTAPGSSSNLGATPDAPKASVSGILTNFALGPGDVVYVDTGVYQTSATIPITALASGTNGNPVIIQGSTNDLAGGSVIRGAASGANAPGFTFSSGVQDVALRDLIIQRRTIGVSLSANTRIDLERLRIESNFQAGVNANNVSDLRIHQTAIRANRQEGVYLNGAGSASLIQSAVWVNTNEAVRLLGGRVFITNSVLAARGPWRAIFSAPTATNIVSDYNLIRVEDNASVAVLGVIDRPLNTLAAWQAETGMDARSLDAEPRLVNPDEGEFHPRSQTIQGRFDPLLGWVTDTVTSPLIDAGDPTLPFDREPAPSGGRANIGVYGNSSQASRADLPRLYAASLNQGGYVKGTATLHWVAGSLGVGERVRVEVSVDGGESWNALQTGILASAEAAAWNTTTGTPAVACLWRVVSEDDPDLASQVTNFFSIRNQPLTWHVNDDETSGDRFTGAAGASTNWMASSNRPLDSVNRVFDRFDLEPGDRILVDRGEYPVAAAITVQARHSGAATSGAVVIMGAADCPGGVDPAATLVGPGAGSQPALLMDQARFVAVSNLAIRDAGIAVSVLRSEELGFDGLQVRQSASNGVVVSLSDDIEFRRSLFLDNRGYGWLGSTNSGARLINSVFLSNRFGAVWISGGNLGVTNSVFVENQPGISIFRAFNNGQIRSDYNNLRSDPLANVADYNGRLHKYPASWQQATTNDLHSLSHTPGFVHAASGRVHLVSAAGRWNPDTCSVVTDAVTSVLIDSGDPSLGVGGEPAPNGGRINLGIYGGTTEASATPPGGRLLTLSLNSGGRVRGVNTLYWSANAAATGHLVYLDVSFDNGITWSNIATNLSASLESFVWDASELPSSPLGRWRIGSQSDPSLAATTEVAFTLNNGSIGYFVNDAATNGDVYTTAPGDPANDGLTAETPLDSLESVFGRYIPEPGDLVYVDTGEYEHLATIGLDENNSGVATNPVVVQGSTNWSAGGSRINMNKAGPLFELDRTKSMRFADLVLTNTRYGFTTLVSSNITFSRIHVVGAPDIPVSQSIWGFNLRSSTRTLIDGTIVQSFTNASGGAAVLITPTASTPAGQLDVRSSVLWGNGNGIWAQVAAPISLSNSVIQVPGVGAIGLQMQDTSQFYGDFNNYRVVDGGRLALLRQVISVGNPTLFRPIQFVTLQAWRDFSGLDTNSLAYDPGFADPEAMDFTLLSQAGRWTPSGLVTDLVTSVLIDAGNPAWGVMEEPEPNGGRINLGAFGDTARASLTPTNQRALVIRSLHDGGIARGTNVALRWDLRGDFTGDAVTLQVSTNFGSTWSALVTNLPATQTIYRWDSTTVDRGFDWVWRLFCEQETQVDAVSEKPFNVRNQPLAFYVNDGSVTGDVYTSAIGISTNSGLGPDRPVSHIGEILGAYELLRGDVVYVDTGLYPSSGGVEVSPREERTGSGVVSFVGSTNRSAGGTVLVDGGLRAVNAADLAFRNFSVRGVAAAGVSIIASTNVQAEWIDVMGAGHGLYLNDSVDVRFRNAAVNGSLTNGLELFEVNRGVTFDQGVIWTNRGAAVNPVASVAISNSVLAASGPGRFIFTGSSNQNIQLDYNVYVFTNGARLARLSFGREAFPREFADLASWRTVFQTDGGSQIGDPLFADPAGGNYFPRSSGGRWSDAVTGFVADVETSRLVDTGDPEGPFGEETDPNGARMNIGLYGNTPLASRSPVDGDFLLVTLNDGGSVSGTNVALSWVARGPATGHTVRVEVSVDEGSTWSVLASNVSSTTLALPWNTTGMPSTVLGLWRVISETDPLIEATAAQTFAIRNGPVSFYVNDASMLGDVYTTTQGLAAANGASPATPVDSLSVLLDRYDIEPGDLVYLDTGTYTNSQTLTIDQLDGGFRLLGSTNTPAGGSRLVFSGAATGLRILEAPDTRIESVRIDPVATAVAIDNSDGVTLRGLQIRGAGTGIQVANSESIVIHNSSIRGGTVGISASRSDLDLQHLVLWSNQQAAVNMSRSSAVLENSVIGLFGGEACSGFVLDETSGWASEYNLFDRQGDALIARRPVVDSTLELRWQRVATWSRETGNDLRSLAGSPGFANAGAGDFHPLSAAGRFDTATGSFVVDALTSVLIDAGSAQAPFDGESGPNGGRVNIGMHGNTFEASRSPTNSRLAVARLNDGGRAEGPLVPLTWVAAGMATGHTLRLEVSLNDGFSWSLVQSNIPAQAELLYWDSDTHAAWFARWRIISEQEPGVVSSNAIRFAVRNAGLPLYLNDGSILGDVYTTGWGDDNNDGIDPAEPRATLSSLLRDFDLEPGDTIYMDTGEYVINQAVSIGRYDAWDDLANLIPLVAGGTSLNIVGSTNDAANGTLIIRSGLGNAFELQEAYGVRLAHLRIQHAPVGGGMAVRLTDSPYAVIEWCRFSDGTRGISLNESEGVRMRHLVIRNQNEYGILVDESPGASLYQSVLWSNAVGLAVENLGSVAARNNAVVALAPDSVCWQRHDGPQPDRVGELLSEYNLLWTGGDAFLAQLVGNQYPGGRRRFERLANWNQATGLDLRTLVTDPFFASPQSGDFHPRSPYGRYVTGSGYITNATEAYSPLIDTGDPTFLFAGETAPNGQRANIGLYGNNPQSSLSSSNGALEVLTFRDGGSSSGEITLRWAASGPARSHPVTLEFSNDGGATWTNIVSGLSGAEESYVWNSEPYGRAAAGLWRIISDSDTNITSQTEDFFALRQGGTIPYFINDANTAGDVYSTAPGNDDNNGFLPSSPKATLQQLLDDIDLEPGDIVYMDTGIYAINLNTEWGELDGGDATNAVVLRGSTNILAGGTVMDRITGQGSALVISRVQGVAVEHMTFINGQYGVTAELSLDIALREITARNNVLGGVHVLGTTPLLVENSLIWNNPEYGLRVALGTSQQGSQVGALNLRNSTVWGSRIGVFVSDGGSAEVRNSLIRVNGDDSRVYLLSPGNTNIVADYNAYFRQSDALVAERQQVFGGNDFFARLIDWQRDLGNDLHSLSHDPLVANGNGGDFHLVSASGRTLPGGGVTNDAPGLYSPLIDTGDPTSISTNEPEPNGGRINIGRYGNTPEASRSRTNGWLLALTLNDGGRISGTNVIRWAAGNWPTSATIRLEYANNGVDYGILASNLPVYQAEYTWDASQEEVTQFARWRVVSENDPGLSSPVQSPFIIKNEPLAVYVNDGSLSNDVYTFAVGSVTNTGRTPFDPLHDPGVALDNFPFSEGDTLYIDTGVYVSTNTFGLRLGLVGDILKAGLPDEPIRVVGSTNNLTGGTRITSFQRPAYGFRISRTQHIRLEHMTFYGFTNGVEVADSEDVGLFNINSFTNEVGFRVANGIDAYFDRCAAWHNEEYGLEVVGSFSSATFNQGVLWSNHLAAIRHIDGPLVVSNSILAAASTNALLYEFNSRNAVNDGDYNLYWPNGNPSLMRDLLGGVTYRNVRAWQRVRGMDTNSFVAPPRFADPANGDFHLQSDRGRYQPASGGYTNDALTSWAIDAGPADQPFFLEPSPNGGRRNIGLYGHTGEASLSSTNRALFVVSLRDGGTAANPQPLIWLTRGLTASDRVRIEYTPNDGVDWDTLATNVPALDWQYLWDNGSLESTPLARWRITLESDSSIADTSGVSKIRNGPIFYYVNDTNLVGDVYTEAPGSIFNNGITVSTPVHAVETIIDRFQLEGGDILFVDTGDYILTNNIVIRADDSGLVSNRVVIRGSTNRVEGGTRFYRMPDPPLLEGGEATNAVFELVLAQHIEISDMLLENADIGIYVNNPEPVANDLYLRDMEIRDGEDFGVWVLNGSDNTFERVLIHRMQDKGISGAGSGNRILSSILWSNRNGALEWLGGSLYLSNSVFHAYGPITNAALHLAGTGMNGDYNHYFVQDEASYVLLDGEPITGLPQWSQITTQDLHSISVDPLFDDPADNRFFPRSPAGRFDPDLQGFVTNDPVYSVLIDAGNPAWPVMDEPSPNGNRFNIGLHGGTPQASKSRTEPWLLAVTAMAGGRAGGIFSLYWFYGNLDDTNRVALEFSVDGGTNWHPIASNLPINQDGYLWNSPNATPFNQSPTTKWRVLLATDSNVVDETDRIFGLNGPFRFFVNDTETTGDVFTTSIGDDANLGISSNAPKATLRAVLDTWDVDPEDFIYIDTGTYLLSSNDLAIVRINNRGEDGRPVTLLGSEQGAVLDGSDLPESATFTLLDIQAPHILVDHVNIRKGLVNAVGTNIVIRNMRVDGGSVDLIGRYSTMESFFVTNGSILASGPDITLQSGYVKDGSLDLGGIRATLRNTVVAGEKSPLVRIQGTNVTVVNNTLVAERTAIQQEGADSRSFLRNNILVADGADGTAFAIERKGGVTLSDYNLFSLRNGAWYGNAQDGLWERLIYWQQKSGQDTNSIADEPLFADEAAGDYHLKSVSGRYASGIWVTDAVHAAAIDAGAPFDSFGGESSPNGGRINIGAYGNTVEASLSRTTPWLYAMTMNDGGVIRGTNQLRWLAGGMDATNRVTLAYSSDGGVNWSVIASGLPVSDGVYPWDTTTASNSLDALWRVTLDGMPAVEDETDVTFNIRNDTRSFFVNNVATNGDVFTTAPGNPANDGRTPATPKASLEDLFATYDTEAGDVVYVDTGVYTSSVIQVIWSRGGSSNASMVIRGSTNQLAGGSVLRRPTRSGEALVLNASHVLVRDLTLENAARGVLLATNQHVRLQEIAARSNVIGVAMDGGSDHMVLSSRMADNLQAGVQIHNAQRVSVENMTFINQRVHAIEITNTVDAVLQNNIFYHDVATSNLQAAIAGDTGTVYTMFIDYNLYYFGPLSQSNASLYGTYKELLPWQRERAKDYRSAVTNPAFASVLTGDYHLRSEAGRYDPVSGTFVTDTNTSWAIDKGNPGSAFDLEPEVNGGRVNIGAYGNTIYASKGTTNEIVFVRIGNEFLPISEAENPYPLIWHVLNLPEALTFSVQYSGDGGTEWVTLQSGVPAYQEYIVWTNSPIYNSFKAKWRVIGEGPGQTNYTDLNDGQIRTFFGIHRISKIEPDAGNKTRFIWRGAWDEDYQIQFATNRLGTNRIHNWQNIGSVTNLTIGGDIPFTDPGSSNQDFRIYRVIWLGTNGVPYD